MRICMLVRNAVVHDARVRREAKALADAGHDVVVVGIAERGLPERDRIGSVRVVRIEPLPFVPLVPPSGRGRDGGLGRTLRARPNRSALAYAVRDAIVTRALTRAACTIASDVYHAHDLNTLAAGVRAAERARARLVYDAHELYPDLAGLTEGERARWRSVESRLIGRADRVITVSASLADELVDRYGITRPTVLMNVGERGTASDGEPGPVAAARRAGELLVLYSGGVSANRGIEALVDAAAMAHGWRLVVMGWGPLVDELRARAPGVAFVEPVAPDAVTSAAAAADVGVIPYIPIGRNNELSLPNKLFEYIGAGIAVAASDLVELRRFIDESRAGVLFRPGDAGSIATTLDRLAAEPARVMAMKDAARAAAARYTWDVEKKVLLDLYATLA